MAQSQRITSLQLNFNHGIYPLTSCITVQPTRTIYQLRPDKPIIDKNLFINPKMQFELNYGTSSKLSL